MIGESHHARCDPRMSTYAVYPGSEEVISLYLLISKQNKTLLIIYQMC